MSGQRLASCAGGQTYLVVLDDSVAAVQKSNKFHDTLQKFTGGTSGWRKYHNLEPTRERQRGDEDGDAADTTMTHALR